MNADLRGLADRVAALLTDWGDTEMREERDAIAAELRSLSVAQGQGWEAVPESGGQGFDFVDIANRAQYATGYGIMPSTAKAVIEAAGVTHPPAQASGAVTEEVEYRLWGSQWVNVVNHERAYADWEQGEAIAHAVKLTEQAMAKNVRDGKWPPVRSLAQGGGNER